MNAACFCRLAFTTSRSRCCLALGHAAWFSCSANATRSPFAASSFTQPPPCAPMHFQQCSVCSHSACTLLPTLVWSRARFLLLQQCGACNTRAPACGCRPTPCRSALHAAASLPAANEQELWAALTTPCIRPGADYMAAGTSQLLCKERHTGRNRSASAPAAVAALCGGGGGAAGTAPSASLSLSAAFTVRCRLLEHHPTQRQAPPARL